ncbi:MAG TPA: hypothetical protein VK901_22230, partial [Nitrospiraceae bacterium]|nr:hypothetical protein [Nitrospiraceae bacterium]
METDEDINEKNFVPLCCIGKQQSKWQNLPGTTFQDEVRDIALCALSTHDSWEGSEIGSKERLIQLGVPSGLYNERIFMK